MLFSSMIFLWAFLPTVLILYWMAPSIRLKNIVLLVASLIFYAWGEPIYIFLMLFVVLINYVTALLSVRFGRVALIIGVTGNLMILGYFKYFNFLIGIVNSILRAEKIAPKEIVLPLGISFFTFQAMSYAIDVYRGNVKPCYNFFNVLLYVSLFPQLVAGPIVRYSEVAEEITNRQRRGGLWYKTSLLWTRKESYIVQYSCGICRYSIQCGERNIFRRCALVGDASLHTADILRLLRLFGYGYRFRPNVRLPFQ